MRPKNMRLIRDHKLKFKLGKVGKAEKREIEDTVRNIPYGLQAKGELELQVTAIEGDTYYFNTGKVINIEPVKGSIESVCHSGLAMIPQRVLTDYGFLWSGPKEIVMTRAGTSYKREIHLYFSSDRESDASREEQKTKTSSYRGRKR